MIESIIHTLKHLTGLCGEAHPSLIMSGTALMTYISFNINNFIQYLKNYGDR